MSDPGYFSDSYATARARFLAAAEAAGARISSHINPTATGPGGLPLYLDTAWIGPDDASNVLLNTSGTHGAEGYVGSAAQLAWLMERGPASLPPDTAVYMVHAVNPFGFAWGLRGTENNVDLNRNWLDHSSELPDNPLYDRVHPFLCPKHVNDKAMRRLLEEGARLIADHGQWALEDAITRGQYTHADGFHYGGDGPEWSTDILRQLVRDHLSTASQIGFIDWHSGPVGNGELIFLCFSPPKSDAFRRASSWWGEEALDAAHVNALWGSKRPSRRGIMFHGIAEAIGEQVSFGGAVIEFRSALAKQNPGDALRASMLERWLRFEGGLDAPEAPAYIAEIVHDYAPKRPVFRLNVIANALDTYDKTLAGLGRPHVAAAAD